jgi:hypothetical protein
MIRYASWEQQGAPLPSTSSDSPRASASPDEVRRGKPDEVKPLLLPEAAMVATVATVAVAAAGAHVSPTADRAAMESSREMEEVEALIEDINALASQIRSEPIFLGGDEAHELVFDPYAIYYRPTEPVEAAAAAYSP